MGYKSGSHSIKRKKVAKARALAAERERFDLLEDITCESKTLDSKSENWEFYKSQNWRYSREWKAFFAPPESA